MILRISKKVKSGEELVMSVVRVPRPPRSAMNKERRISDLIRTQIEHLRHVEKSLPGARADVYPSSIKTEGEAAQYIAQVTARLHPQGAAKPAAAAVKGQEKKARAKKAKSKKAKKATSKKH